MAVSVNSKRMTVSAVVLDDHAALSDSFDPERVTVEAEFEVKSDQPDLAVQLGDTAKTITGRLRSLQPDVVVVRRADLPMRASNKEGPRLRLLMEGAVTAASHEVIAHTSIRNGKDCGRVFGSNKDALDSDAESVRGGKFKEATAAALSALSANRTT